MKPDRVLVFGGSFNPPHNGHFTAMQHAAKALSANKVIIVPSNNPPHKTAGGLLPFDYRVELLKMCMGEDSLYCISGLENETNSFSYSSDIVEKLDIITNTRLCFLVGEDNFRRMPHWVNIAKLLIHADIAVLPRFGLSVDEFKHSVLEIISKSPLEFAELYNKLGNSPITESNDQYICIKTAICRFYKFEQHNILISSTNIREKWKRCEDISGLVDQKVADNLLSHKELVAKSWESTVTLKDVSQLGKDSSIID